MFHPKEALISALKATEKPVAFLVGSPVSHDSSGKGVPGIAGMLNIVDEVVTEKNSSNSERYKQALKGKTGAEAYQMAMSWLQANIHQDAVNLVVRRAVLEACHNSSALGDLKNPQTDGDPSLWDIPTGAKALAALCCLGSQYKGPILTPNFDPLLSLSIQAAGKRVSLRILDTDGSLPRDIEEQADTISIIHLHGYWRGSDTMHTPSQLKSPRPKLKASLQRILRNHTLVVIAYGGWDDVFTNALTDLLHDDQVEIDVLWCFLETNPALIQGDNKQLLDSVAPAIARGRFRSYCGIDCHTIFSDLSKELTGTPTLPNNSTPPPDKSGGRTLSNISSSTKPEGCFVDRYFSKRLDDALVSFSSQPKVWVEPTVSKSTEVAKDAEAEDKVNLQEFVANPKSTIIKAPPQFGLTCLAHFLIREAWRTTEPSFWLYLDSKDLKPNQTSIEKAINNELDLVGLSTEEVGCVIIDSWSTHDKESFKLFKQLCSRFKDVPIVVMQTVDSSQFLDKSSEIEQDKEFDILFLWSLPRCHVRKVVSSYNDSKHIGDEDKVTSKVVNDLEMLNLHRTPLNCLTLLKVSEIDFDESPVNRSEMIKRVLFLLFNVDDIPTYKIRPDLKDSEYVLGYFCELMIRENNFSFSRNHFLAVLEKCCKERMFDLEVQVVFDVLYKNNIIIKRGSSFSFRFTFWIYYFIAQRMHHNKDFAEYIFDDMRYVRYPEIMEFYTGIDRHREDALHVITKDMTAICEMVKEKCGFPDEINPYQFFKWNSSGETIEKMKREITDGVMESNLPASVKDRYADRDYDRARPYSQDIRDILTEHTFVLMFQAIITSSRALRNSDYVEPEVKKELLRIIMDCWGMVSKVMLILSPILAQEKSVLYDGAFVTLGGDFGDTPEKRFFSILNQIPANVALWFQNDLFSQKMGPLITDCLHNEKNQITKHEIMLMLIIQRPRGWKSQVKAYIVSVSKNSFYLWNVHRCLRAQYRYSYASSHSLSEMEYLIKMAAAKHTTGSKNPGITLINKEQNAIPERKVAS